MDRILFRPTLEFRANMHQFGRGQIDLYALSRMPDGQLAAYSTPIIMKDQTPESMAERIEPAITINPQAAVQLMDDLWEMGIRPSEGHLPTQGALKAQNQHLEDMRKIAFGLMEKGGHI